MFGSWGVPVGFGMGVDSWAEVSIARHIRNWTMALPATSARLAQSVERKALNLVVVGSSPTVGVVQCPSKGRCRCMLHCVLLRQTCF